MAARHVRGEFHDYAKELEKVKRDVEKTLRIARSQAIVDDQLEDIIPCLKRILERIVYGCMVVQIPVYG